LADSLSGGATPDGEANMTANWCILTVKWRHRERTLSLSGSLAQRGFQVWVPVETRKVEAPRLSVKREVQRPLLPGYIFARREHLIDLIQLTAGHPSLRVFRCREGFHITSDRDLQRLRDREREFAERYQAELRKDKERKPASRALNQGDMLRARDGSFGGKVGIVTKSDPRRTIVCFDRFFGRVEIPTSIITEDDAYELQSATDYAAKRAA
jgi:transcription antitermination factor NusG